MSLEVMAEVPVPVGLRPSLRRVMKVLLKHYQVRSSVCVILADDAKLRSLKRQFWNEDAPTDVLSFPQWEPGDAFMPETLGDVVISLETAQHQATERGHSLSAEVAVLCGHGLMHLLGFDHQTARDWQPFLEAERLVLETLSAQERG